MMYGSIVNMKRDEKVENLIEKTEDLMFHMTTEDKAELISKALFLQCTVTEFDELVNWVKERQRL